METLRYLNKEIDSNERNNFSNWWLEQINIYGQKVIYYQNASTIESSNISPLTIVLTLPTV
jgi:hypothetical protein